MNLPSLSYSEAVQQLPPEWPQSCLTEIQEAVRQSQCKVVVLDDDPTGTQTVRGVPVLTEWSVESLRSELCEPLPAFYVLTNSRALSEGDARRRAEEIGNNLAEASRLSGRAYAIISRSDSTLRGHFPGEVEALAAALKTTWDGWLLIPFFEEGGRYTLQDVHYLRQGDRLTPVSETESARDAVFGYRHANLRQWVEEKTCGTVSAGQVSGISVAEIRTGGPSRVQERLRALARGAICVVNAMSGRDLEVFTLGLLRAEAEQRHFLCRTAASFVPLRAGLGPSSLLVANDLALEGTAGGLIVVGSYVPRTTAQVEKLLPSPGLQSIELDAELLRSPEHAAVEIRRAAGLADRFLRPGRDVVIYTSRQLLLGKDPAENLAIGQRISEGIVSLVRALSVRPRYLLAKGGITSSDVATDGLGVRRALVLGQILPGVPVWRLGPESRFPGLDYIVFPGNVGTPEALRAVVEQLQTHAPG